MLHAEHGGGNNSSFTIRVVTSSGTDTFAAVSSAINSLKGPKHGGANHKVTEMVNDIKENISDWTDEEELLNYLVKIMRKEAYDHSGLVYGMGHAVYTLSDPRAVLLKEKAEELIARLKKDIAEIDKQLGQMTAVTIKWFTMLKEKYGARYPRQTEIRNFDNIVAAKVVEANQKLSINRAEGFIGTSLKKDEFVTNCSDMDDIILFYKDGKYKIVMVS
jgi:hypothetical protein